METTVDVLVVISVDPPVVVPVVVKVVIVVVIVVAEAVLVPVVAATTIDENKVFNEINELRPSLIYKRIYSIIY